MESQPSQTTYPSKKHISRALQLIQRKYPLSIWMNSSLRDAAPDTWTSIECLRAIELAGVCLLRTDDPSYWSMLVYSIFRIVDIEPSESPIYQAVLDIASSLGIVMVEIGKDGHALQLRTQKKSNAGFQESQINAIHESCRIHGVTNNV